MLDEYVNIIHVSKSQSSPRETVIQSQPNQLCPSSLTSTLPVHAEFDKIAAFQSSQRASQSLTATFDGLTTEIEFWNFDNDYCHNPPSTCFPTSQGGQACCSCNDESSCFDAYSAALTYMRSLRLISPAGRPVVIISYVSGHLAEIATAAQVSTLSKLADRVDPACYTSPDPAAAFRYCQGTIRALQASSPSLAVFPIFSSESEYMGPWLAGRANPLDAAEAAFNTAASASGQVSALSYGFQYFEYGWMSRFIGTS